MKFVGLILAFALLFCSCNVNDKAEEDISAVAGYASLNYEDMKAMWVSQYDLAEMYTKSGLQREKNDFTELIEVMVDNISSLGINTVIVQVRPFADSMYPSEYYPMSSFVTGAYGREADYDPFEIIIEKAHERGLSVHAWINPLRAMTENEMKSIPQGFKIKEWYDSGEGKYIVNVSGRLYLNPAYEDVRNLICDGVSEIIGLYDVDGIHMDDYFYPTTDLRFDTDAYAEYRSRGGTKDRADFRRDNINRLVREIYSAVKTEREDVLFGISPSGVTVNNYNELYADVAEWCGNEGYIDYICPQVYFGFEHSTCGFVKVCREFSDMIKSDGVRLVVGMTLGKAVSEADQYAGDGKDEWKNNKDILKRELEYTMTIDKCSGASYFSYQYFFGNEASEEISNLLPVLENATWK